MSRDSRYQIGIILIASVLMLTGLKATSLWDQDEGFFASTAAEMHANGDWVVPSFNGSMFGHKPPWMYWMMMIGFQMFGTTEFSARLFSAIFGIGTCLLTYQLGKKLFCPQVGWWSAIVLASSILFNVVSRAATPDTYLTFFVTLSFYLFARYTSFSDPSFSSDEKGTTSLERVLPKKWHQFAIIYSCMGFATLVKGPIGFFFPMTVIGLFLMSMTPRRRLSATASRWQICLEIIRPFGPTNFFVLLWRMRIFTAIAVILLVATPWYLAVGIKTSGSFLYEFFAVHHYHRFTTPMDNHSGPIVYYLIAILVGMFPWSVFALPISMLVVRRLRKNAPHRTPMVFVVCWIGVYVGIFSIAGTKLPNYILPACPALAITAGVFLQSWINQPASVRPALRRLCVGILPLIALLGLIGLPLAGTWQWNGSTLLDRAGLAHNIQSELIWVGLAAIPLLIGGLFTILYAEQKRSGAAILMLAWSSVITLFCVWNFAAPQVGQYQTNGIIGKTVCSVIRGGNYEIAHLEYFPPSLSFYIQQQIRHLPSPSRAIEFLDASQARLLITTAENYALLKGKLGGRVKLVGRAHRFPKPGEIMILTNNISREKVTTARDGSLIDDQRHFE